MSIFDTNRAIALFVAENKRGHPRLDSPLLNQFVPEHLPARGQYMALDVCGFWVTPPPTLTPPIGKATCNRRGGSTFCRCGADFLGFCLLLPPRGPRSTVQARAPAPSFNGPPIDGLPESLDYVGMQAGRELIRINAPKLSRFSL